MATKIIKAQITQRHDTRSNWESVNPVLLEGELGLVSDDPNLYKVGDGRTEWNNLPYRGFDGTLVQEEGTSANAAMSQKAVTEALAKMPNTTGTYPSMRVGTADDLAGRGESVPASFGFRASGGKSIKDGRAYIKRIKGNSVVWNQLADSWDKTEIKAANFSYYDDYAETNLWHAFDPIRINMNMSARNGHKILMLLAYQNESDSPWMNLEIAGTSMGGFGASHDICKFYVVNVGEDDTNYLTLYTSWDQGYVKLSHLRVYDLTLMFGAGTEPTTIEEFNARVATLGVDLYAYNEGEVIHCNTESIKSVGDNAWDEQWELGRLNTDTGQPKPSNDGIHSKNYNKVLPNEVYYCGYNDAPIFAMFYDAEYNLITQVSGSNNFINIRSRQFTTPANAVYMKFYVVDITTYNHDIMITLVHSGWKIDTDAGYQPYWEDILPLPVINKYFPDGMKSAGSAHDEIRFNKASGKWEAVQRVTSLDLGTLAWGSADSGHFYVTNVLGDIGFGNLRCAKYSTGAGQFGAMAADKVIGNNAESPYNRAIFVRDDAYTDAESFKAAMQGVILYYELAGPIVTELDAEDQNFRDYYNVADFGTEQSQSNVPSAPFSADIIYQFNAVDMIRENAARIAQLEALLTAMQAQITSLTNNPE